MCEIELLSWGLNLVEGRGRKWNWKEAQTKPRNQTAIYGKSLEVNSVAARTQMGIKASNLIVEFCFVFFPPPFSFSPFQVSYATDFFLIRPFGLKWTGDCFHCEPCKGCGWGCAFFLLFFSSFPLPPWDGYVDLISWSELSVTCNIHPPSPENLYLFILCL